MARAVVNQPTDLGGFAVVNTQFKTFALLVQWVQYLGVTYDLLVF